MKEIIIIVYGVFCFLFEAYFVCVEPEPPPESREESKLHWREDVPRKPKTWGSFKATVSYFLSRFDSFERS